jgi:hypothetical protein
MAEKPTLKPIDTSSSDDISLMSDREMEEKIKIVKENHSELIQIRNYIIKKHLKKIDREGSIDVLRSAFPSLLLLLFSVVVDVSYVPILGQVANSFANYLFPGASFTNQNLVPKGFWWLPFAAYILFILFAYFSNRSLKKQIATKGPAADIISRIIESYSGLVDAIGTAMPLLGAAILLISIKVGPTIFLGFSVPFEIKSIIILAIAKLFGSVFEVQGLQFQAITEEVSKFETEYSFFNQSMNQVRLVESIKVANEELIMNLVSTGGVKPLTKEDAEQVFKFIKLSYGINEEFAKNITTLKNTISELSHIQVFDPNLVRQISDTLGTLTNISSIIQKTTEYSTVLKTNLSEVSRIGSEINNIKIPDAQIFREVQKTSQMLIETITNLRDSNALKSLENLVYLAGKR